ncbi:hypothetical protein FACS1894120_0900 [Clostridia bacterium]|nr:hypothetical protein FACS1894120_0900 [Clostridia bacterium]
MKEFVINIHTIDEVKRFVNTVSKYSYDVDVVSGRYAIDAKSIMGLFSLDLSKDLKIKIHSESCDDLAEDLKPFIV